MLQYFLHREAVLSDRLGLAPLIGGSVLILAGAYQLTPLKLACLRRCRSPLGFLMTEWREGLSGAIRMGLNHGLFCIGCCWLLMAILFVTGVMNLLWVALIAAFVLAEKVAPAGRTFGRLSGVALVAWGIWIAAGIR
jgi:predicted metal-binding membrane protein